MTYIRRRAFNSPDYIDKIPKWHIGLTESKAEYRSMCGYKIPATEEPLRRSKVSKNVLCYRCQQQWNFLHYYELEQSIANGDHYTI